MNYEEMKKTERARKRRFGILLALITCPENKEEHTAEQNELPVGTVRVAVNDLWGQEEYVKLSYLLDYGVRL